MSHKRCFKPLALGLLMSEEETNRRILGRFLEKVQRLHQLSDSMEIPMDDSRWRRLALELARLYAPKSTQLALLGVLKDDSCWFWQALELAQLYVPELKTSRQDGAPTKWHIGAKFVLIHLVARRIRTHGLNKAQACAALAADDPWLSNVEGKPDGDALARQCTSQRLKAALKDRDEFEQAGKLEDFDALIDEGRTLMIEIAAEKSSA